MKTKLMALSGALAVAAALLSVAAVPEPERTGSTCVAVLGQDVCTWVVTERGEVRELGATIPMRLIEAVPTDVEMVWPPRELATVPFPVEAKRMVGIDHLGLNWEAHGHPPATFATPHFDFHFYSVTEGEVRAIDCTDESKPAALAAPYVLPDIDVPGMGRFVGLCVPSMGMHAMPASEVDETDPFQATMMVGYYGAKPIFVEPMVSRALLLRREGFELSMPEVGDLSEGVRYPRAFRAEYDADEDAYRLVFSGFDAQ